MGLIRPKPRIRIAVSEEGQYGRVNHYVYECEFERVTDGDLGDVVRFIPVPMLQASILRIEIEADALTECVDEIERR